MSKIEQLVVELEAAEHARSNAYFVRQREALDRKIQQLNQDIRREAREQHGGKDWANHLNLTHNEVSMADDETSKTRSTEQ